MMKITGLSHLFKWENLHNWWLTKYFFAPLYIPFHTPSGFYVSLSPLSLSSPVCRLQQVWLDSGKVQKRLNFSLMREEESRVDKDE